MTTLTYVIIGFMVWLAVYCIIDRICTAVENAAMAKAYSNFLAQGKMVHPDELKNMVKNK
jgi:hypothetical protein